MLSIIADFITINFKQWPFIFLSNLDRRSNHLVTLLKLYPYEEWEYHIVCARRELTWDYIKNHLDWELAGYGVRTLYKNPNITYDIAKFESLFMEHATHFEHKSFIAKNPNVTWDLITTRTDIKWDFNYLSQNPSITYDIVKANPQCGWCKNGLFLNPSISIADVLTLTNIQTYYYGLSEIYDEHRYTTLTIDIVLNYRNVGLNMTYVSQFANISINDVKNNLDIHWSFRSLMCNRNITIEDIMANPQLPWKMEYISHNPNISMATIAKYPHINWDYKALLYNNKSMTWEDIVQNLDKDWEWYHISRMVPWQIIAKNPNMPWDWTGMSRNPTITWRIVRDNPNRDWCFSGLSYNKFEN